MRVYGIASLVVVVACGLVLVKAGGLVFCDNPAGALVVGRSAVGGPMGRRDLEEVAWWRSGWDGASCRRGLASASACAVMCRDAHGGSAGLG